MHGVIVYVRGVKLNDNIFIATRNGFTDDDDDDEQPPPGTYQIIIIITLPWLRSVGVVLQ